MVTLSPFYIRSSLLYLTNAALDKDTSLRHTDGQDPESAMHVEPISQELADLLLASLPAEPALVSRGEPRFWRWWPCHEHVRAYDVVTGERVVAAPEVSGALAAESFVTVPCRYRGETLGGLYLTASRRQAFDASDVAFLLQVLEQIMPTLDNLRLVDRLATEAAETERQRIARDLHDSVLQPYIGLQVGLAGLRRKIAAGRTDMAGDIEQLSDLATVGLAALHGYIHGLRESGEPHQQ